MRKEAPGSLSGLSLVELMVGMALAAIVLPLGLPALGETLQRQRAASAMAQLGAQLAQARNTAISRRMPVTVCPSLGDGRCQRTAEWSAGWLLYRDPGRNDHPRRQDDVLRDMQRPIHETVRIHATGGRLRLRYQPDGRSGGSNLTLRVCTGDELRGEIIVNNVGRVRTRRIQPPLPCPAS